MTEYGGSAGGTTRGGRALADMVQSGAPATQYHDGVVSQPDIDLVEQPLVYDGNLPARRFIDGVEVAPDGTEPQHIIAGEDETGGFVESKGYRFSVSDLALAGGEGRNSVLAAEGPLEAMGEYEPSEADQVGATIWVGKIGEIARDLKIPEATTIILVRRMLDTYSELRAAQEERDRLQAKATGAQLDPGDIDTIEAHLKDEALFPDGFGEEIVTARMADGSRLVNHPTMARYLAAHEVSGGEQQDAVDENEYAELTKLMGTDIGEFMSGNWRGMNITPSERMLQIDRQRRGEAA
jgi:hypothetical protein